MLGVVGVLLAVGVLVSAATAPPTAATTPPAAGSAPAGRSMRVATFNIWGNVGHQGKADWIADAVKEVVGKAPGAMSLQEACRNQAQEFASRLGMHVEFMRLMPHRCDNGEDFGNAVLYQGEASGPVLRRIMPGIDEDEPRGLICVPLTGIVFCSIHLSIDRGRRGGQTSWLSNVEQGRQPELAPLGRTDSVVVAGDFNADPPDRELDPLFDTIGAKEALGPRGEHTEATHNDGRKIDYIFTWGQTSLRGAGSHPSRYSDHYLYSAVLSY
jgi:endonuclease/exonuclease/phosphatase family metal-dependent hydrolase